MQIKQKYSSFRWKVPAFNLQEILIVLAIIGVLLLVALPNLLPYINKAKSIEAQIQLKAIYTAELNYRYLYSKYGNDFNEIDFEPPMTTKQGGSARYQYTIIAADGNSFKARAQAVEDFDGDGVLNIWEIDEKGNPVQTVKD